MESTLPWAAMSKRPCPLCGNPMDRLSNRCRGCSNYGKKRNLMPSGYIRRYVPGHPLANKDGYALEHRWLLHEMAIPIPPGYHVHHKNGNKADNWWSNLEVLPASDHLRHHIQEAGVVENQYGTWPLKGARCST